MTEESMFWSDGLGDGGPYTQDQLRLLFDALAGAEDANRGVLWKQGSELVPSSTGANNIRMATGRAVVDGTVYGNDAILDIVTTSPVIGTTGRRLVLQKDWAARTVRAVIISSADGDAGIPALTQADGTTWEIPIASFTITTGGAIGALTDQREFCESTDQTVRRIRKTASQLRNNNTTLIDVTDMVHPIAANEVWIFEGAVFFQNAVAAAGIKFGWTFPAAATLRWAISRQKGTLTTDPAGIYADGAGPIQITTPDTSPMFAHIMGTIVNGANADDLQLQFAQQVATVGDTTFRAHSWLRLERMPPA